MLDMISHLHAVNDANALSKKNFKLEEIIRILDNVFQIDIEILYTLQLRYKICYNDHYPLFSQLRAYHRKKKKRNGEN